MLQGPWRMRFCRFFRPDNRSHISWMWVLRSPMSPYAASWPMGSPGHYHHRSYRRSWGCPPGSVLLRPACWGRPAAGAAAAAADDDEWGSQREWPAHEGGRWAPTWCWCPGWCWWRGWSPEVGDPHQPESWAPPGPVDAVAMPTRSQVTDPGSRNPGGTRGLHCSGSSRLGCRRRACLSRPGPGEADWECSLTPQGWPGAEKALSCSSSGCSEGAWFLCWMEGWPLGGLVCGCPAPCSLQVVGETWQGCPLSPVHFRWSCWGAPGSLWSSQSRSLCLRWWACGGLHWNPQSGAEGPRQGSACHCRSPPKWFRGRT